MDEVRCNICDSDNEFEISNTGRFGLKIRSVVCKECGLVYTNPRLDHNENHMFYKYFYKIFFRGDDNPTTRHIQNQRKNGKLIYKYLNKCELNLSNEISVLDVGCSGGGILDYFREIGWKKLVGIEPSVNYAEFAKNELNLEVYNDTLEGYIDSVKNIKYDLIIMRDIVEHLLNPKDTLSRLHVLLNDRSVLYIETNNVYKSLNPTLEYSYQFHYGHPYIFSSNSIKNLLTLSGYKVIDLVDEKYIRCIAVPDILLKKELIKEDYNLVIKYISNYNKYLFLRNLVFNLRVLIASIRKNFRDI